MSYLQKGPRTQKVIKEKYFRASMTPEVTRHFPPVLAKEIWIQKVIKERYSQERNSRGGKTPPTGPDGCAT